MNICTSLLYQSFNPLQNKSCYPMAVSKITVKGPSTVCDFPTPYFKNPISLLARISNTGLFGNSKIIKLSEHHEFEKSLFQLLKWPTILLLTEGLRSPEPFALPTPNPSPTASERDRC